MYVRGVCGCSEPFGNTAFPQPSGSHPGLRLELPGEWLKKKTDAWISSLDQLNENV